MDIIFHQRVWRISRKHANTVSSSCMTRALRREGRQNGHGQRGALSANCTFPEICRTTSIRICAALLVPFKNYQEES